MAGTLQWKGLMIFFLTCAVSCSSNNSVGGGAPQAEVDLREVADLLRMSSGSKKSLSKVADLKAGRNAYPRAFELLQSGEIVVVWEKEVPEEGAIESGTAPDGIIAYESRTPSAGGFVLLQNGKTLFLSQEEFLKATEAK